MSEPKAMSWPVIVAITAATILVTGLALGLVGRVLGLSTAAWNGGVGAAGGIVAAILYTRRRTALARR